jgi:hypothetical protein
MVREHTTRRCLDLVEGQVGRPDVLKLRAATISR